MSVISQHEGPSGCEADRARSGWTKPTSQWLASGLIAADLQQLAEIHIIEQRPTTENRLPTRARAAARSARAVPAVNAGDEDVGQIYLCLAARVTRHVVERHNRRIERRLNLRFSNNRTSRRDIGCCPC
jgi:hypothetical protein